MPRARDPNRDKAHELYNQHSGNITNREIANTLGVDEKIIAVWKQRDNWNVVQQSKPKVVQQKKKSDKPIAKEVKQVIDNPELTDKQRLFCIYFIKSFNAAKAYQKAYGCDLVSAYTAGPRLLKNVHIIMTIEKMKQNRFSQAMLRPEDIVQKYIDIANSDITDYITFGKKQILIGHTKDDVEVYENVNFMDYKDSNEIDGTLITEVKQSKDGISIKLMNREKALQWLSEHMDMATTEQKARIDHMKNKDAIDRERFEHDKNIDSKKYW